VTKLAQPERLGPVTRIMIRLLALTPLVNYYWNRELKRNGAFHKRNATPYVP
jgi:hypothetical protein